MRSLSGRPLSAGSSAPGWWRCLALLLLAFAGGPAEAALVALVTRSFAGDELYFRPWFASVEMYWPYKRWPVVVVMDDTEDDRRVAGGFPEWVTVYYEPLPASATLWPDTIQPGRRMKKSIAYMRVNWSQWHFDQYTDAEFIALTDIDAVFHTWTTSEILFERGKPRVVGHCPKTKKEWERVEGYQHKVAAGAANLEYVAEFMFYLPFLMRRSDLAVAREFLVANSHSGVSNRSGTTFETWYVRHAALTLFFDKLSSNSMQNVMGHWLWEQRQDNVSFHIEPSWEDGRVKLCEPFLSLRGDSIFSPVPHPATHLAMVKNLGWKPYSATANNIMWSAYCGVGAHGGTDLRRAVACLRRPFSTEKRLCGSSKFKGYDDTGKMISDLLQVLVVSAPYWPGAWEKYVKNHGFLKGLSDKYNFFGWTRRILTDGARRLRRQIRTCESFDWATATTTGTAR